MDPIIAHDELPQEFTPALPCFHFGSFELPLNGEQRVLRQFTAFLQLPAAESFTSPAPQAFNLSASCVVQLRTGGELYKRGQAFISLQKTGSCGSWLVVMSQRAESFSLTLLF